MILLLLTPTDAAPAASEGGGPGALVPRGRGRRGVGVRRLLEEDDEQALALLIANLPPNWTVTGD